MRAHWGRGLATILLLCGLACGQSRENRVDQIRQEQLNGRFGATIEPLRQLLAEDPDHPEINHLYGLALLSTGRPSLSIWSLRKAASHPAIAVENGILLTRAHLAGGSAEDAIGAADQVLVHDPENVEALRLRLQANLESMKNDDALLDVERILEIEPNDLESRLARIRALLTLNRVDDGAEAIEEVSRVVENMEDEEARSLWLPRVCGGSASFADERGDPEAAEQVWEDCLTRFPDEDIILQAAVEFFDSRGQPDRSLELLQNIQQAKPNDLAIVMPLANRLANRGRRKEEQAILDRATQEDPDHIPTWISLASYYEERNEPAKARDALFEALSRVEQAPIDLVAAYADLLIRSGDYDKVEPVLADLEDEPLMLSLLRGRLDLALGRPAQALAQLEEGLSLWPSNTAARFLAGQAAEQLGDDNRALQEYMESHRADHANPQAIFRLTKLLEAMGRGTDALPALQRYLKKKPMDPDALLAVVRIASQAGSQGQVETALNRLSEIPGQQGVVAAEIARRQTMAGGPAMGMRVIQESGLDLTRPHNHPALSQLVGYLVQLKRAPDALALTHAAVNADPEFAAFHETHGRALRATGSSDPARKALERAIALEPNRASALGVLGDMAATQGHIAEAISLYDQAALADPDDAAHPWRAILLSMNSDDPTETERRLETMARLHGHHPEAMRQLSLLLIERDPERAIKLARRAVRFRGGPGALETLARVQAERGQIEPAIQNLRKSLELRPHSPSTLFWLGRTLAASGDSDGARQALITALEAPAFPEQEQARAELSRLNATP